MSDERWRMEPQDVELNLFTVGFGVGFRLPSKERKARKGTKQHQPCRSVSAIEGKTTVTETERMREQMGTPEKPAKSLV